MLNASYFKRFIFLCVFLKKLSTKKYRNSVSYGVTHVYSFYEGIYLLSFLLVELILQYKYVRSYGVHEVGFL